MTVGQLMEIILAREEAVTLLQMLQRKLLQKHSMSVGIKSVEWKQCLLVRQRGYHLPEYVLALAFYMTLAHMVEDKIQSRARGFVHTLTR